MSLIGQQIVIFGGSGALGAAMARVFAGQGAHVVLCARRLDRLEAVVGAIRAAGGSAEALVLDCLDAEQTRAAIAGLATRSGGIDAAIHATSALHDQGTTIDGLDVATFLQPVDDVLRALFNATKAVVPQMGQGKPGVILTLSTPAGRTATPGHLGYSVTCAGIEAFTRVLAAELGPRDIRVLCLAPHAISDAPAAGSYTAALFAPKAAALGLSVEEWLAGGAGTTMLGRLPTLSDVAETAAFLVSGRARAMTAAYVNLTAGMIAD